MEAVYQRKYLFVISIGLLLIAKGFSGHTPEFGKVRMNSYSRCTEKLGKLENTITDILDFEESGSNKNSVLDSNTFYTLLSVNLLACVRAVNGKQTCSENGKKMVNVVFNIKKSIFKKVYGCNSMQMPKAMLLNRGRVAACELTSLLKDIKKSKDEC